MLKCETERINIQPLQKTLSYYEVGKIYRMVDNTDLPTSIVVPIFPINPEIFFILRFVVDICTPLDCMGCIIENKCKKEKIDAVGTRDAFCGFYCSRFKSQHSLPPELDSLIEKIDVNCVVCTIYPFNSDIVGQKFAVFPLYKKIDNKDLLPVSLIQIEVFHQQII